MRLSVCLGVVGLLVGSRGQVLEDGGLTGPGDLGDNNLLETGPGSSDKSLQELCSAKSAVACLKLTLIRGLDRLARRPGIELLPGLTVQGDMSSLQDLPRDVTATQLDEALLRSLARYLSSLSLTVKVMDSAVMQRIREVGETITQKVEDNSSTGRRKPLGSGVMMAGLMSGGSMMALGMAAIAAMAGKALMTALLSLMMSAMSAMKGGGGGGGTSYEVIHAHDKHHRSMDIDAEGSSAYSYFVPTPSRRRNVIIPLHKR